MTSELKIQDVSEKIEAVVIGGDLSKLSPSERVNYYKAVCQSVGLNPLTRPFDYITLNRKLTLYARKDATDQLRRNNLISIGKPDIQFEDDWIIVTVAASDQQGRNDSDVGVVNKNDMQGNFGNALMKAVTKAKRRVTLSICGLGMLDETEVETIPNAKVIEAELDPPENAKMDLDTAIAIENRDGKPYGDIDSETLSHMSGALAKSLKGELSDEDREVRQMKLDGIKVILADRNE